jgi:hypothetical protein
MSHLIISGPADDIPHFSFDDTLLTTNISNDLILKINAGLYPTSNPLVTIPQRIPMSTFGGFTETATQPANTAIRYQIIANGLLYWWNPTKAKWDTSDGTYSQSSLASDIDFNSSAFFSDLNILTDVWFSFRFFLHSTGASTPVWTSVDVEWFQTAATTSSIPNQCIITASLRDITGSVPLPTAAQPATLLIACDHAFFHGTNLIEPFTKSFAFSTSTGIVTADIIETATPGVKLNFAVTYYDGQSLRTVPLFRGIIPNQASINLSDIGTVNPVDFG